MVPVERRKNDPGFKGQLDALLDAAVDAIVLIDLDGRITRFNSAAERMFGYPASEVIGQNVNCLMPEPYRSEHDGYLGRYLKTGEARIIGIGREVTGRRRDGSVFPIELSVGEVTHRPARGYVGIIRDITQRKQFEEQLARQREELRLIFESTPTGIVTIALDNRLLNANRAWHDLLGYSEQDLATMICLDFVHPEDAAAFAAGIERMRRGGTDVWRSETRLVTRWGDTVHALVQAGIIRSGENSHILILEMVDRTAQALAEREAKVLRENLTHISRLHTMGEMAAGIAHELNQPLTAISTYAQGSRRLIASGAGELPEIVGTLEKIAMQAERAGDVIRRLRALLVRHETQREAVDCGALIRDIVKLAELDRPDPNVAFQLAIEDQLPRVPMDKVQIQQVLLNLLRNAVEAMGEAATGGEITVSAHLAEDGLLEISVSDRGPGVSESVASRLFDPFFTTKSQGMGMGLAICRSIVHAHGGSLEFGNNRYGGATFTIRLPVESEAEAEDESA